MKKFNIFLCFSALVFGSASLGMDFVQGEMPCSTVNLQRITALLDQVRVATAASIKLPDNQHVGRLCQALDDAALVDHGQVRTVFGAAAFHAVSGNQAELNALCKPVGESVFLLVNAITKTLESKLVGNEQANALANLKKVKQLRDAVRAVVSGVVSCHLRLVTVLLNAVKVATSNSSAAPADKSKAEGLWNFLYAISLVQPNIISKQLEIVLGDQGQKSDLLKAGEVASSVNLEEALGLLVRHWGDNRTIRSCLDKVRILLEAVKVAAANAESSAVDATNVESSAAIRAANAINAANAAKAEREKIAASFEPEVSRLQAKFDLGDSYLKSEVEALDDAIKRHDAEAVNRLLNSRHSGQAHAFFLANVPLSMERHPLKLAIVENRTEICRMLIESGANVNQKDWCGFTPLRWAVQFNNIEVCKLLIEQGANVNEKCKEGGTPLTSAAWKGNADMCRLLVDNNADLYARTDRGLCSTALLGSIIYNKLDTSEQLLDLMIDRVNQAEAKVFEQEKERLLEQIKEIKDEKLREPFLKHATQKLLKTI